MTNGLVSSDITPSDRLTLSLDWFITEYKPIVQSDYLRNIPS